MNVLEMGVELVDSRSGNVVWQSKPAAMRWSTVVGLYYHWADEFGGFPELYRAHAEHWAKDLGLAIVSARAHEPAFP